jgi:hypothetical protein
MAKRKEHRKHKRFQAQKGVFVGVGPYCNKVGRLRDISMDGLAFRHVGTGDVSNGSYVDIFMTESDFYLGRLPIKIISDVEIVDETPTVSSTMRRCRLRFGKLTDQQRAKLQELIESHTIGEA